MNILFIDPVSLVNPYDTSALSLRPLGGSEATVIRVANGLSKYNKVFVAQRLRKNDLRESESLSFISFKTLKKRLINENINQVILLREFKEIRHFRFLFPNAKFYLWLHDMIGKKVTAKDKIKYQKWVIDNNCTLITVSNTHKKIFQDFFANPKIKITYIYNPIDENLIADSTPVDNNKLVFFSSPHKGLNQILYFFKEAKKYLPELKLFIANPGYFKLTKSTKLGFFLSKKIFNFSWDGDPCVEKKLIDQEGIEILGALKSSDVINHVRSALCVFYPQNIFPETFGLVFAEANAVGTPVLAHDFGSAKEILSSEEQLINSTQKMTVINKLKKWHIGERPHVFAKEDFRLSKVITVWQNLFTEK